MIKILFFIPGLSEGGAEKVLCNLVNNMDQTKFNITVQTIDNCDSEKYLVPGIRYKAINRCKTRWGRKLFSYWFRLCAEFKLAYRFFVKDDYDIEIAYLETLATKVIAQSADKKAVKIAWVHCDLSQKEGIQETASKMKRQYKKYNRIICVSEDVQKGFRQVFGDKFETNVLHNVIDEENIRKQAEEQIYDTDKQEKSGNTFLAVGRLTKQKNFNHLINICAELKKDGFLFHLDILGEGPEKEVLTRQIKELNLNGCVRLCGYKGNPYPWMKKADAIVCSSKYEGLSSVIIEALILGKTVITVPCSGMQELLGDSEYGIIAEDSDKGLCNCMKAFLINPSVKKYYEKKALERSHIFLKSEVLKETENLFLNMLKKNN